MLSIIIPTFREEDYLPLLLESIKRQNFNDCEIIVADADSDDKTIEIAEKYGCIIVKGGMPAKGRNEGAKAAKGNIFLFLDADVVLLNDFLKKTLEEFEKRNLGVASLCLEPQTAKKRIKLFFDYFYNIPIKKLEKVSPYGAMGIFAKKEIHNKIKGFDETMKMAEDHDYVRRAAKFGKFGVIKEPKLLVSLRRFERDGWVSVLLKYFFAKLYYHLFGPVRTDIFKYKFGHYTKKKK